MNNAAQFWANARQEDLAKVQDKWWERLAHIRNGVIGDGLHVAYEWSQGSLIRAYIGHEEIGPCLQYDVAARYYTGNTHLPQRSSWYNCYSRGNYGKRYACGGNWSGHVRGMHPRIMSQYLSTMDSAESLFTPDGGVKLIEIDCSPGWAICYATAAIAFSDRLTAQEIQEATLPIPTKQHMAARLTEDVLGRIKDVIEAYDL